MTNIKTSQFGLSRRATILSYDGQGNVTIGLDEIGLAQSDQSFTVPIKAEWMGSDGQFAGGYPSIGSSVLVHQIAGGQYSIDKYLPSRGIFTDRGLMGRLTEGRYLVQSSSSNFYLLDPEFGFLAGDENTYLQVNPQLDIISHNFKQSLTFTEASRTISGIIKRDIIENSTRALIGSTLDSQIYDQTLTPVAFDTSTAPNPKTSGEKVRNPTLTEVREVIYEYANSFNVLDDATEASRTSDEKSVTLPLSSGKFDSRATTLSLGQYFPNQLIEKIQGNVVDSFGNLLDLNRVPLPIGKIDQFSLRKNTDKISAVSQLKALHRKALAYHFEINTKKSGGLDENGNELTSTIPDVSDTANYSRNRSRFFVDIDKEGQFKINVPASSETGNIPLFTRYENYSTLQNKEDSSVLTSDLVRNSDNQDIFHDSFISSENGIMLKSGNSELDGYAAPIDRITDLPIKFNTPFHDITQICSTFLNSYDQTSLCLFDSDNTFNKGYAPSYDFLVNPEIITSGVGSNSGGRSGSLHLDGSLMMSVGADTLNRNSLICDYQGSALYSIGRDLRGISIGASLSGDVVIELGGEETSNDKDDRFPDFIDGEREAAVEIRVKKSAGLMTILRIDKQGVKISTQGRIDFEAQGNINFKTNSYLTLNSEELILYADSKVPRKVLRKKVTI